MIEKAIGIDLGGTNMRAALVSRSGSVSKYQSIPTPTGQGPNAIVEAAAGLIKKISDKWEPQCIGLAVANVVNVKENKLSKSPNIPDLNDFDLAAALSAQVSANVSLENDATAAAVGEHWLGAGQGTDEMICITLGTGVGGGVIVKGEPLHGADGFAGEIGHICLDREGPQCGCGSNGCLEQYASGTAIVRMTRSLLSTYPDSELHSKLDISPKDVYESAAAGDNAAAAAFAEAGRYLGTAMAGLVNIFNPEMIVVTGGVAAAWDFFIGPAREEMCKRAFQQPAERVKIVRGTLGDDAGVIGAAKRAFSIKGFS
jgi:glucokinase